MPKTRSRPDAIEKLWCSGDSAIVVPHAAKIERFSNRHRDAWRSTTCVGARKATAAAAAHDAARTSSCRRVVASSRRASQRTALARAAPLPLAPSRRRSSRVAGDDWSTRLALCRRRVATTLRLRKRRQRGSKARSSVAYFVAAAAIARATNRRKRTRGQQTRAPNENEARHRSSTAAKQRRRTGERLVVARCRSLVGITSKNDFRSVQCAFFHSFAQIQSTTLMRDRARRRGTLPRGAAPARHRAIAPLSILPIERAC